MFQYYTAIIFTIIFSMGIMFLATVSDKVLPKRSRRGFLFTFFCVGIVALAEWVSFYADITGNEYRYINIVSSVVIFTIAPTIPHAVASSIIELKYNFLYRSTLIMNFILQILSARFGFIYYVDLAGDYYRGDFYWIYIIIYFAMTILLFVSSYNLSKKYQNRNRYILLPIGLLLLSGMIVQMTYIDIPVVWLTGSITAILMYIYFYALVNQMDALTTLLNRRCYENQLRNLKNDAIIIMIDVNKFKQVNDNFGHPYGDYCLRRLGNSIKKVYGEYGTCYRIGGDEFCVILEKNLSFLEQLNINLNTSIKKKQEEETNLPGVSIGYGYYYINKSDFLKVVDEADEMMYVEKHKVMN